MSNLNTETDFIGNAIGIDPSGCGCTDCIVGNSINAGSSEVDALVQQYFNIGRRIVNRDYCDKAIYMRKSGHGEIVDLSGRNLVVMEEDKLYTYFDMRGMLVLHSQYCHCGDCESGVSVSLDNKSAVDEVLSKHFDEGATIINLTGSVLIVGKDDSYYGEGYIVTEIEAIKGSVELLLK